jgi:hypothetical protein
VILVGFIVAPILYKAGQLRLRKGGVMKKDISLAVMATILVLQLICGIFGGIVENVTDKISETLSTRVEIERILSDEY